MTIEYYNGEITVPVGSKDGVNDLTFDQVDGYVYLLKELDFIFSTSADTANNWHAVWLSVLKDGRASYNPFTEGFDPDIIGTDVILKTTTSYGIRKIEREAGGYVVDDPYFTYNLRMGVSAAANVAVANIVLPFRAVAERVKATQAIQAQMYGRSYT